MAGISKDLSTFLREFPSPVTAVVWLVIFAAMFYVKDLNYLLFHSVSEGFSIIVGVLIYVLATKTYKYSGNNYLLFLGIANIGTSILTFFHLVSYYGIGILPSDNANISTQFWVACRYLEAGSLLFAPTFAKRWVNGNFLIIIFILLSLGLTSSILWVRVFPECFVQGSGLTHFKIISEYVICLVVLAAIIQLYRYKNCYRSLYLIMIISMLFTIIAELCFTMYNDVYGLTNFLGHVFKVLALYTIFEGVVLRGLQDPYETIFQQLKSATVLDPLTGLYNRQGFIEKSEQILARSRVTGQSVVVMLIDLDNFKQVNDHHGHLAGDNVLKKFARILKKSVSETVNVFRLGGDEFVVIVEGEVSSASRIGNRLRTRVGEWALEDEIARNVGVSIGWAEWHPGNSENIDAVLRKADKRMYEEKVLKKSTR